MSGKSNRIRRDELRLRKYCKSRRHRENAAAERERKIGEGAARKGLAPIVRSKLKSRSVMPSREAPTLGGRYYLDWHFKCKDCGAAEVWTSARQKWWHEEMEGEVERIAARCRECRAKERRRKEEARRIHLEGLERKNRR